MVLNPERSKNLEQPKSGPSLILKKFSSATIMNTVEEEVRKKHPEKEKATRRVRFAIQLRQNWANHNKKSFESSGGAELTRLAGQILPMSHVLKMNLPQKGQNVLIHKIYTKTYVKILRPAS